MAKAADDHEGTWTRAIVRTSTRSGAAAIRFRRGDAAAFPRVVLAGYLDEEVPQELE